MERRSFFTRCFGALAACVAPAAVKAASSGTQPMPDFNAPLLWNHNPAMTINQFRQRVLRLRPLSDSELESIRAALMRKYTLHVRHSEPMIVGDKIETACWTFR